MKKDQQKTNSTLQKNKHTEHSYSRREFLKVGTLGLGGFSLLWSMPGSSFFLNKIPEIDNPLTHTQTEGGRKAIAINISLMIVSLLYVPRTVPMNVECGVLNAMG